MLSRVKMLNTQFNTLVFVNNEDECVLEEMRYVGVIVTFGNDGNNGLCYQVFVRKNLERYIVSSPEVYASVADYKSDKQIPYDTWNATNFKSNKLAVDNGRAYYYKFENNEAKKCYYQIKYSAYIHFNNNRQLTIDLLDNWRDGEWEVLEMADVYGTMEDCYKAHEPKVIYMTDHDDDEVDIDNTYDTSITDEVKINTPYGIAYLRERYDHTNGEEYYDVYDESHTKKGEVANGRLNEILQDVYDVLAL